MAKDVSKKEAALAAKALEKFLAADTMSKRHIYTENFFRGLVFSIGGVIGTTIGVAAVAWVLSSFDQVPIVGPFVKKVNTTVNSSK